MRNIAIWGIVAGAAAATAILTTFRRSDGSRLSDGIKDSAKQLGNRVSEFGNKLKARLLHHVQGPNGEAVYLDMYNRQFYENDMGQRVYLEND